MTSPIISICCVTYNHAPFIHKALDGFLMQEPPTGVSKDEPWYEILIHDDCSTDGTTEIIKEYAAKYPDKIFPLYEEENQYSKGADMDFFNYNRARGKYIAYCEGDDYWTDPRKLQKQVDFMDAHPEYSICFHDFSLYDSRTGEKFESRDSRSFKMAESKTNEGIDISVDDYFHRFGQPLTMLFRVSMFNFRWKDQYKYYRDTHEIYHLLKAGKGYWLNFNGAMHIRHSGGVSTSISVEDSCWIEREHILEMYQYTHDAFLADYLVKILLWNYEVYERFDKTEVFHRMMCKYLYATPLTTIEVYFVIFKRRIKQLFKQ